MDGDEQLLAWMQYRALQILLCLSLSWETDDGGCREFATAIGKVHSLNIASTAGDSLILYFPTRS